MLNLMLGGLLAANAGASPSHGKDSFALTFEAAVASVETHPVLEAWIQHTDRRRRIDRDLSSVTPRAQVVGAVGWRRSDQGESSADGQITVAQGFVLSEVGSARKEAAGAERQALSARARAERLRLELQIGRAWVRLWGAQRKRTLAAQATAAVAEEMRVLERITQAGLRPIYELAELRVHAAEVELLEVDAEGERFEAEVELARTLAHSGPTLETQGSPPAFEFPDDSVLARMFTRAVALPEVQANLLALSAARVRVREGDAATASVLSPQVSLQREGPDQWVAWVGVGWTLPPWDGGAKAKASRADTLHSATVAARRARLHARAEMQLAFHEIEHAQERLVLYEERLLPAAKRAASLRRRAVEVGEAALVEALIARRRALRVQIDALAAEVLAAEANVQAGLLLQAIKNKQGP